MSVPKGHKWSEEHNRKIGVANRGKKSPFKGVPRSEEIKRKISKSHMGISRPHSYESRLKMSSSRKKENNPNWRGGISTLQHLLRKSVKYDEWRKNVFARDEFMCVIGGKEHGNKLNADHIKPFSEILVKYNITTTENGFLCKELWDVNNGRTLCEICHRNTDSYGWKQLWKK